VSPCAPIDVGGLVLREHRPVGDKRKAVGQGPWRPGATPPKPSQPTKVVTGRLAPVRAGWELRLPDGRSVLVHVVSDLHPKLLCGPSLTWDLRQVGEAVRATPVQSSTLAGIRARAAEAAAPPAARPSKKQEKKARQRRAAAEEP
jgi:hypothetical protein